jgi:hypothetical protein
VAVTDTMVWRGGVLRGTGVTSGPATAVIQIIGTATKELSQRTLDNFGLATWTAGELTIEEGAILNNLTGALFEAQASDCLCGGTGAVGAFNNSGTLVVAVPGASLYEDGVPITNSGIIEIQSGTFEVAQPLTHLAGGVLQGNGTLDMDFGGGFADLSGDVNPGTSPGILTIISDLPQGSQSTINIELNGTVVGAEYDRLAISGLTTLGGSLDVTVGFAPALADTFTVLTFGARSGGFAGTTGLNLGGGIRLDTVWTDTSLSLVAALAPTTVSWANASSGNWSDPANWNPTRLPTADDTVAIDVDGDYTVTLNVSATVASLVLGGASGTQMLSIPGQTLTIDEQGTVGANGVINLAGTLTGSGPVSVGGAINWSSGTLSGTSTTTILAGGALNLTTGNTKIQTTRLVENLGTITWSDGAWNLNDGAAIDCGDRQSADLRLAD